MDIRLILLVSLMLATTLASIQEQKSRVRRSIMRSDEIYRWPDNTVYYRFATRNKAILTGFAMIFKELEAKTCLKFVQLGRQWPPPFHVQITNKKDGGCVSKVGYFKAHGGTSQDLNISDKCLWLGRMRHELLHALGMFHMMQAPDRDDYVTVQEDNISQAKIDKNFKKEEAAGVTYLGGKYDFASVMHYGYNAFALDSSKATIIAKDSSKNKYFKNFGNVDFSFYDLYSVNKAYKCNAHCSGSCPEGTGYFDRSCKCVRSSDPAFANWPPVKRELVGKKIVLKVKSGDAKVKDVTSDWTKSTGATVYEVLGQNTFLVVVKTSIPTDLFMDDGYVEPSSYGVLYRGAIVPTLDKHFRSWWIFLDPNFQPDSAKGGLVDELTPLGNCEKLEGHEIYPYVSSLKDNPSVKKIDIAQLGVPGGQNTKATLFQDPVAKRYLLKLNNQAPTFSIQAGNTDLDNQLAELSGSGGCKFRVLYDDCLVICNTSRGP